MTDNMIDYLPDNLRRVREFSELCTVNDPDKAEMKGDMDIDTDDFFTPSATADGIERWESIMQITAPGGATIEERRFTLSSRVNNRSPFSEKRIIGMLDTLLGNVNYDFTMSLSTFILTVDLEIGTKYMIDSVKELLNNVVPAHIDVMVNIKWNTHQMLSVYTHEQLSEHTHSEIQEMTLT